MEKIVVCGAGGFVGQKLVEHLVHKGHDVRAVCSPRKRVEFAGAETVQADLEDLDQCESAIAGARWVFNLAAKVGGIGYIQSHKASCMLGVLINANLLQAARNAKIARYFFSSSSCVYPESDAPLRESDAYPANPTDGYGWEKLFSERMCLAFQEEFGVPVTIARYHGLYGPGDVRETSKDHVIAALCRRVVEAKLSGRHEITIWGDGTQMRSFLYIDDCIEGTLKLAWNAVTGPFNLGNSKPVSVNQLVTHLELIAGVKLTRFYSGADGAVGRKTKITDNQLIRDTLGWEPMTSIESGLARTYRDVWDRMVTK